MAETKPPVKKVVSGTVRVQDATNKPKQGYFAQDAKQVGSSVLKDIIIPGTKRLLYDIFSNALGIALFGGNAKPSQQVTPINSLGSVYQPYAAAAQQYMQPQAQPVGVVQPGYAYRDVILASRGDAELVINTLRNEVAQYGSVSVADLYQAVGYTPSAMDYKFGWTDLRMADAQRCMDGTYRLALPRAVQLP